MPQTDGTIRFVQPYRGKLTGEKYYEPGDTAQLSKRAAHALVDSGFAEHVLSVAAGAENTPAAAPEQPATAPEPQPAPIPTPTRRKRK